MAKYVILMGKSSSGKDTIYKELINRTNLKIIVPYTTRPPRTGEVNGKDYFFVTDEYFENNKDKIIESRTYDTVHGKWTYGEFKDHQINEDSEYDYIFVTTPEGYEGFLNQFDASQVVPIYISVDNGIRLQRALDRERSQEFPKYAELCRRFLADEADFSDEKLLKLNITKQFENNDLQTVLDEILLELSEKGVRY